MYHGSSLFCVDLLQFSQIATASGKASSVRSTSSPKEASHLRPFREQPLHLRVLRHIAEMLSGWQWSTRSITACSSVEIRRKASSYLVRQFRVGNDRRVDYHSIAFQYSRPCNVYFLVPFKPALLSTLDS